MSEYTKKKKNVNPNENTTVITADLVELEFSADVEATVSSGSIELGDDVFNASEGKKL